MGEWTTAAAYKDGDYVDTPVRIDRVYRGSDAQAQIDASGAKMNSKLQDGCEWLVIDYSVDMTGLKAYSDGSRALTGLSLYIRGLDGSTLKYGGKTYFLTGSNLLRTSSIKTDVYNGKYVYQIPIGCTDYLIQAKATKGTEAYIKGE